MVHKLFMKTCMYLGLSGKLLLFGWPANSPIPWYYGEASGTYTFPWNSSIAFSKPYLLDIQAPCLYLLEWLLFLKKWFHGLQLQFLSSQYLSFSNPAAALQAIKILMTWCSFAFLLRCFSLSTPPLSYTLLLPWPKQSLYFACLRSCCICFWRKVGSPVFPGAKSQVMTILGAVSNSIEKVMWPKRKP